MHKKWLELRRFEDVEGLRYCWKSGFAVFYSPVQRQPDLMIMGFNPGGGPVDFNETDACKLPCKHSYMEENYRLAEQAKKLFANHEAMLTRSVKANLIPFRSRSTSAWYAIRDDLRFDWRHLVHRCAERLLRVFSLG